MKKNKKISSAKLTLSKETLRHLAGNKLNEVPGAGLPATPQTCTALCSMEPPCFP